MFSNQIELYISSDQEISLRALLTNNDCCDVIYPFKGELECSFEKNNVKVTRLYFKPSYLNVELKYVFDDNTTEKWVLYPFDDSVNRLPLIEYAAMEESDNGMVTARLYLNLTGMESKHRRELKRCYNELKNICQKFK